MCVLPRRKVTARDRRAGWQLELELAGQPIVVEVSNKLHRKEDHLLYARCYFDSLSTSSLSVVEFQSWRFDRFRISKLRAEFECFAGRFDCNWNYLNELTFFFPKLAAGRRRSDRNAVRQVPKRLIIDSEIIHFEKLCVSFSRVCAPGNG